MEKINEKNIITSFKSGESVTKIAKENKISRQCVYNILKRKNINYKKEDYHIDSEMLKEKLKNNKMTAIMNKYKIPYSYLRKIMKEQNIEKTEIMKDRLDERVIKHLYDECGFNDEQIGSIFNCSQYTVRSFRWDNGIYDKNRNWKKDLTKDKFNIMRKSGKTLADISRETGYPYHIIIKAKQLYENKNEVVE